MLVTLAENHRFGDINSTLHHLGKIWRPTWVHTQTQGDTRMYLEDLGYLGPIQVIPKKNGIQYFFVIFIFCMAVPCFSWICFLFLQTSQRFWPKKNRMAKDVKKDGPKTCYHVLVAEFQRLCHVKKPVFFSIVFWSSVQRIQHFLYGMVLGSVQTNIR